MSLKGSKTGHDGRVVSESAVAVDLDPVLSQGVDIVEGVGPIGMTGDEGLFPAIQSAVDLFGLLGELATKCLELLSSPRSLGEALELFEPLTQLDQGLFEWHIWGRHDRHDASKAPLASQFAAAAAASGLREARTDRHRRSDHRGSIQGGLP